MKKHLIFLGIVLINLVSFGQGAIKADSLSYREVQRMALPESCKDIEDEKQLNCLLADLQASFEQYYSFDSLGKIQNPETRKRIVFSFMVGKQGSIKYADAYSLDSDALAIQTVAVLNRLSLNPGINHDKPIGVYYNFYLFVTIKTKDLRVSCSKDYDEVDTCSFGIIDDAPVFPGCESLSTRLEKKRCFSSSVNKFVAKKFNVDIAQSLGLGPGKKRIEIKFTIGKTGEIEDVMVRAPHRALELEAKRVIKLLPKMIPGKQQGEVVRVKFRLPIVFEVIDDYPVKRKKKRRGFFSRW